jgi:hypothetical protein
MFMGAARAQTTSVEYVTQANISSQSSDASRTLTINSGFNVGDVIIAMTGNLTSTPPSVASGYTDIISRGGSWLLFNTVYRRSIRLQYKIATSTTESISWIGAYGWMVILRNFTGIGQSASFYQGALSSTPPTPSISGLDTSGRGYLITTTYLSNGITGVDSPYSLISPFGGVISENTASSLPSVDFSASVNVFDLSAVVEVL